MKKVKIILTIVAIFIMTIGFANTENVKNDFTKCEITMVDDVFVDKDIKAMWTLNYSGEDTPITVIKHKTTKGIEYVVHSKYFDVSYASTKNGFGTVDVRRSCVIIPKKISNVIINQNEWEKQKILTPNKIDDKTALGLISCYLPILINDEYSHLLK